MKGSALVPPPPPPSFLFLSEMSVNVLLVPQPLLMVAVELSGSVTLTEPSLGPRAAPPPPPSTATIRTTAASSSPEKAEVRFSSHFLPRAQSVGGVSGEASACAPGSCDSCPLFPALGRLTLG